MRNLVVLFIHFNALVRLPFGRLSEGLIVLFDVLLRHRIRDTDYSVARGLSLERTNAIIVHHPGDCTFVILHGIQQGGERLVRRAKHASRDQSGGGTPAFPMLPDSLLWELIGELPNYLINSTLLFSLRGLRGRVTLLGSPTQTSVVAWSVVEPNEHLTLAL
jgi:hypothetical protein